MQAIINNSVATAKILLMISGGGPHAPVASPILPPPKPPTAVVSPAFPKKIDKVAQMKPVEAVLAPQKLEPIEPPSLPVAPTGTYSNDYEWGNCTEYVASKKKVPNSMGDANKWHYTLTPSQTPQVGSIAQSTKGIWGHVAIVEAIDGNMVTVSEMNVVGLGVVSKATHPINYYDNYFNL